MTPASKLMPQGFIPRLGNRDATGRRKEALPERSLTPPLGREPTRVVRACGPSVILASIILYMIIIQRLIVFGIGSWGNKMSW